MILKIRTDEEKALHFCLAEFYCLETDVFIQDS